MWMISVICLYLLIGMLFGINHVTSVLSRIKTIGEREIALRNMVKTYELSPQGAEYYAQLQDLHLRNQDMLSEYKLFKNSESTYQLELFFWAAILWPYYWISISLNNKTKKRESGR